jgi:hypothetical protein
MFKTTPAAEPQPVDVAPVDAVPLSHLALDLPEPTEGWALFLGRRGISFHSDDLGRDSISRGDAKRLLDEQRSEMLRVRALHAEREREAVEQDQRRCALIWKGLPADHLPVGLSASTAMLAAAKDSQPRRQSTVAELLDGESLTFHPFTQPGDAA